MNRARSDSEPNEEADAAEPEDRWEQPRAQAYDGPTTAGEIKRWMRAFVPLGAAVALSFGARFVPEQVERFYSRGLYPHMAGLLDRPARSWTEKYHAAGLAEVAPSLAEVVLLAVVVLSLIGLLHGFFRRGIWVLLRRGISIVGAASLLFVGLWGLNHARQPVSLALGLQVAPVQIVELERIAGDMARGLSLMLDQAEGEDADGNRSGSIAKTSLQTVPRRTAAVWASAIEREPTLGWQKHPLVVGPQLSVVIVSGGISGIFSPFTQEAHVATHLPESDLLFTACHEVAHIQGWAREDEANYLAWRVASRSDDEAFRRAAFIIALYNVHRAIERADRELMARLWKDLDPRILSEFSARSAFWARERSAVAVRAASGVNDAYLRSQGHAGVASYGRMVDLIVAEWRSHDLPPILQ